MDKNVLKKFAIESRQELMEKVANKINRYFVDEEFNVNQNGEVYVLVNDRHTLRLTKSEYENRQLLVKRIKEITLEQVIEEAAYTWFNRIIAIRYMEIHDYLPLTKDNQSLGVRVLSSKDNTPDPEIMKISNLINPDLDIEFNKEYYGTIQDNNKRFEYILLLVCKKLGKVIPQVFDGITDYIDILTPDNLLNESGYVTKLLKDVSEENFAQVEIIGWLYQYYVADKKKVIDEKLNKGNKITKEELPTKTQLFTPKEIVKYMVDNCTYISNVEDMRIIDPCCGSGHILVCIFDRVYQEYLNKGYIKNNITELILKKNIFGVDIDKRAIQLSTLSLLLKAREYDNLIFNKKIELNLIAFDDSKNFDINKINFIESYLSDNNDIKKLKNLLDSFQNATEIGSIILIDNYQYIKIYKKICEDIEENGLDIINMSIWNDMKDKIRNILYLGEFLSNQYDIVITNPPYLGRKNCSIFLNNFLDKNYPNSKMDLFSAFIEKTINLCKNGGNIALMTPFTWLYLSSYKMLRKYVIETTRFESILRPYDGYFNDAAVTICSFVLNKTTKDIIAKNLFLEQNNQIKVLNQINNDKFMSIPENRFVFDITDKLLKLYNQKKIEEVFKPRQGMATTNNDLFLRRWFEVNINKIGFEKESEKDALESKMKWFPYNKGGGKRKWYGNNEYVVNFENNGKTISNYIDNFSNSRVKSNGRIINREYYFKRSITWSDICGNTFAARACNKGFIFDVKGSSGFVGDKEYLYILSLLNSNVSVKMLNMLNPTITTQVGNLKDIPYVFDEKMLEKINMLAKENIEISKKDWDNKETSWDYEKNILLKRNLNEKLLKEICQNIQKEQAKDFNLVMDNERILNKIFIDIYNLQNEVESTVSKTDIAISISTDKDLIKDFISYAVGCMFGRYSLDKDGLMYAGEEFNKDNYKTFEVDLDNIIPITEDNYFGDDIVSRFKKFIEVVYGKETLYENLEYIAETLGKKNGENSEETIRRYFINDFYDEHVKMYQKRPIYWLFDSGKKNGFKCLIYMHRYNESLVSKIRLDYLHRMQNTYEKELKEITDRLNNDIDLTSKRELSKRQANINAKLQETNEYDEKIAHIADQKIKIDLDDGVVVNYAKFSVKNPKTGKEESILANSKDIVKKKKEK